MVPFLVIVLAFMLAFAFPQGIRITLGRRSLWLAPPAVPIYSYFRLAAKYRQDNAQRAAILAEMRGLHGNLDALVAELVQDIPELATSERSVEHSQEDPSMQIVVALLAGITDTDVVHRDAFQEAAAAIDELLAQPVDRTIPGLLQDQYLASMYMRQALQATWLRNRTFFQSFGTTKSALHHLLRQTHRQAELQATIDEIAAALQSLGDEVDGLDVHLAQVEQPGRGRPPKRVWSDDEIWALHAAYLDRGTPTAGQFAKQNYLTESQMFKLFRRVGITKKGLGNYDSEL